MQPMLQAPSTQRLDALAYEKIGRHSARKSKSTTLMCSAARLPSPEVLGVEGSDTYTWEEALVSSEALTTYVEGQ